MHALSLARALSPSLARSLPFSLFLSLARSQNYCPCSIVCPVRCIPMLARALCTREHTAFHTSRARWKAGRPSCSSASAIMNSASVLSPTPTWFSSSVHTCRAHSTHHDRKAEQAPRSSAPPSCARPPRPWQAQRTAEAYDPPSTRARAAADSPSSPLPGPAACTLPSADHACRCPQCASLRL